MRHFSLRSTLIQRRYGLLNLAADKCPSTRSLEFRSALAVRFTKSHYCAIPSQWRGTFFPLRKHSYSSIENEPLEVWSLVALTTGLSFCYPERESIEELRDVETRWFWTQRWYGGPSTPLSDSSCWCTARASLALLPAFDYPSVIIRKEGCVRQRADALSQENILKQS